jgi:hypothetical protein
MKSCPDAVASTRTIGWSTSTNLSTASAKLPGWSFWAVVPQPVDRPPAGRHRCNATVREVRFSLHILHQANCRLPSFFTRVVAFFPHFRRFSFLRYAVPNNGSTLHPPPDLDAFPATAPNFLPLPRARSVCLSWCNDHLFRRSATTGAATWLSVLWFGALWFRALIPISPRYVCTCISLFPFFFHLSSRALALSLSRARSLSLSPSL